MSILQPNVYDGLYVGRTCGAVSYISPRTMTPREGSIPGSTDPRHPTTFPKPLSIVPRTGAVPEKFWERWEERANAIQNGKPHRPMTAKKNGMMLRQARAAKPLSARATKLKAELRAAAETHEDKSVLSVVEPGEKNHQQDRSPQRPGTAPSSTRTTSAKKEYSSPSATKRDLELRSRPSMQRQRSPPKTRVTGVVLTAEQRRRARAIMKTEDAIASKFCAQHRAFEPTKIVTQAHKIEEKRNYVAAKKAEKELIWAELKKQETEDKIAALQEEMDRIREEGAKKRSSKLAGGGGGTRRREEVDRVEESTAAHGVGEEA